jgi:TRAP-type C4-dicarboxylate transport system permease small subunit
MKYSWWFIQIIMILLSIFFTIFGVTLFIGSYSTNNPFTFIMIFFSSSLIILISLTLLAGFIIKIIRVHRHLKKMPNDENQESSDTDTDIESLNQ